MMDPRLQVTFVNQAKKSGHINTSDGERLQLETIQDPEQQEAIRQMDLKKKARSIQVSTEDCEVKAYLRQLCEPICLFGEDGADRRERLRYLLAVSGGPAQRPAYVDAETAAANAANDNTQDDSTVWYHQGPDSLATARMWLAEFSLSRAKVRLARARNFYSSMAEPQRKAQQQEFHKVLRTTVPVGSQVGDTRPLSCVRFSPDAAQLATTSWSGLVRLWSVPGLEPVATLRGHSAPVCCVAWHPQARLQPDLQIALASSAQDGSIKLWSLDSEEPVADLEGHAPFRVSRLTFHPSGRFLGTACHDCSWRLWDLEACEEILHQEGHSRPVYEIAFHPDGSLAATAGLDSFARVWDLRTGRCVMFLEGHLESVLGIDLAANGYHAATCSADNSARIWDLRQQQAVYVMPAHANVVSSIRFQPRSNQYLLTTSFDKTARLWGHPIWTPLARLEGHTGKVVFADVSPDSAYLATCSHDLTFKLWQHDKPRSSCQQQALRAPPVAMTATATAAVGQSLAAAGGDDACKKESEAEAEIESMDVRENSDSEEDDDL